MKYVLKKPIQCGKGDSITELNFREEITAGDLRGMKLAQLSEPATEDMIKIASRLCGILEPELLRMSFPDLLGVTVVIGGFLSSGLETGTSA